LARERINLRGIHQRELDNRNNDQFNAELTLMTQTDCRLPGVERAAACPLDADERAAFIDRLASRAHIV